MGATVSASEISNSSSSISSSSSSSCPNLLQFSQEIERPVYLMQLCMAGIGLLLNCLTLGIFLTGKDFKGAPFVFMSALALGDICTLLLKSPECFVLAYRHTSKPAAIKEAKLVLYYLLVMGLNPLGNVTETLCVWLIVCLALERYISMKHYSLSKTKCTSRNAAVVTACCLLAAACTNLFSFFSVRASYHRHHNGSYVTGKRTHFYSSVWYECLSWARAILSQFLPLLFLSVANLRLILVLHRQTRRMQKYSRGSCGTAVSSSRRQREESSTSLTQSAQHSKRASISSRRQLAQRRLTIMLIVVICLVLFGQVPQAFSYHRLFIRMWTTCSQCRELDSCLLYRLYKLLANGPVVLCYSCNFFIYFSLNKHFRCRALLLLTLGRWRSRRMSAANGAAGSTGGAGGTDRRCTPPENGKDQISAEAVASPVLLSASIGTEAVTDTNLRQLSSSIDFIDSEVPAGRESVSVQFRFAETVVPF